MAPHLQMGPRTETPRELGRARGVKVARLLHSCNHSRTLTIGPAPGLLADVFPRSPSPVPAAASTSKAEVNLRVIVPKERGRAVTDEH